MNKKGIRQKLTILILFIVIGALIITSAGSIISMMSMREKALKSSSEDAFERITELAENRATLSDTMLRIAENQTLLVAKGAEALLKYADYYLVGFSEDKLPDLVCAHTGEDKRFINACAPENLLKNIQRNESNAVIYAELNRDGEFDREVTSVRKLTVNEELYLASLLSNEFEQIFMFRTAGTEDEFKGFAASYFCFEDSGIDVLGDPKMSEGLICYDGRTRGWYIGAVNAYNNGTLTDSGVYWTEPVPDGAGRGTSMVCACPVVIDGEVVGVAGSGGLLNDFADLVKSSALSNTGFSFLISRTTQKVIVNPSDAENNELAINTVLSESDNESIRELGALIQAGGSGKIEDITINGQSCYLAYSALEKNDWTMVTVIAHNDDLIMESYNSLNRQIVKTFIFFFILIAVLIVVAIFVSYRFSLSFTNPIIKLKKGVDEIGQGNLDHSIEIKTGDEIEDLGHAFNAMADNLDKYVKTLTQVTAEKERIGAELDVARNIQASMLPCIFPPFPDRTDFDIYATMTPAKEVGGDFYDFFMIDEKHLAIVMADVSGKGVPAALFMVIGKTLIKDHTQVGRDLGEVFTEVNQLLCEANSQELFITAFEGILDLETGEFKFVNAGHEMPFICKKGENYAPYKIRPGFVLAGMENMNYKSGILTLEPGDKLFQYTDGVTEATNANNQLFGMDRLNESLNKCVNVTPTETLRIVKEDIDKFVGEAPQFDDITMLCVEFKKKFQA